MKRPLHAALAFLMAFLSAGSALSQLTKEEIAKISSAAPAGATVKPEKPRKLLVFNRSEGFQHDAIRYAGTALEILAKKSGAFEVVQTSDMAAFEPENLRPFDAVCFNNTTALKFDNPVHRRSLLEFIAGGKGIVGIHAATDNFNTWPEGVELFGGQFDGHPWTADGTWGVKLEDAKHPLTAAFGGKDFLIRDEIYRIRQVNLRKNCRVLLALDARSERNRKAPGVRATDRDLPISWVRSYGKGRLFYCSLGHNGEVYWNSAVLRHYLDGIQFALGDYPVDTTPVPFDEMGFFDQDSLSAILERISTYRFGQSRAAMAELNDFIRGIEDIPEAKFRLEQEFIGFVRGSATADGKQFIFTRLAQIGSDLSVHALAALLADTASSEMALYALAAIDGPAAEEGLLAALVGATGKKRVGITNALGARRVEAALPAFGMMLSDRDSVTAVAAAGATAHIGTVPAIGLLKEASGKASGGIRTKMLEYTLLAADRLREGGDTAEALSAYRELSAQGQPLPVRRGALRGLILGDPSGAARVITQTLRSPEPGLQSAVIQIVGELPDMETVRTIARSFPELPAAGQVQLLSALASRRDPVVQETVIAALHSKNPGVRLASLRALGSCGGAAAVRPLAEAAALSKGEERKEARASLIRLQGEAVDDSVTLLLRESQGPVRLELTRTAGERKTPGAVPILIEWMSYPEEGLRLESARSLKAIAPADHLPALAALLAGQQQEKVRRELELAAIAAARNHPDSSRRDEALLSQYPFATSRPAKLSFLRVMGKIGAPGSLGILRDALDEKDPEIRLSAIRALAEWPTAEPYQDLWRVVNQTKDRTEKTVALRGAFRLLSLDRTSPSPQILASYKAALQAAPSAAERKLLLSSVGQAKSLPALLLAAEYLGDKTLHDDAEAALLQVAADLESLPSREVVPSLEELIRRSTSSAAVAKATDLIRRLERFDDHIMRWQYAGPYEKEGANLFNETFAPEEPGAPPTEWKPFPVSSDPQRAWLLDFGKALGGTYRVVYVRTNVFSRAACRARLEVGSDDGVKVWLNGALVHSISQSRSARPGSDVVHVTLKEGWNTLLMKINQTDGEWGACARVRSPEGRTLEGIRTSAAPI